MKTLRLYGAGLLAARNINGGGTGGGSGGGGGSGRGVGTVGTTWTQRTWQGNSLFDVTYGNGLFVAVGSGGIILTSPDGVSWTLRNSGTSRDINGVAYAKGLFVAVGERGTIVTSPDGVTWTAGALPTSRGFWGVAYGNGLFVAVGGGTILTSP